MGWGSWTTAAVAEPRAEGLGEGAGAEGGPHRPGETDSQSWPLPEARVASSVPRVFGFGLNIYRMETACPWTLGGPAHQAAGGLGGAEEWMVGVGDQAGSPTPHLALCSSHSLYPCLSTPPPPPASLACISSAANSA